MTESPTVIVLSGAGGGCPDLNPLRAGFAEGARFTIVGYPDWRQHTENIWSMQSVVEYLINQIETLVPEGPIRIIGISIGGHFGYAAAVRLQAAGREISGFCAIDSFMVSSAAPSSGWLGRALGLGTRLIGEFRIADFGEFVRSRFWRALLRLSQDRLATPLPRAKRNGRLLRIVAADPMLEHELSMRLLIRAVAPGLAALDSKPVALKAPAALLRTGLTTGSDESWRRRCPGLKIVQIPGNHETMFEPQNVVALGEALSAATRHWGTAMERTASSRQSPPFAAI